MPTSRTEDAPTKRENLSGESTLDTHDHVSTVTKKPAHTDMQHTIAQLSKLSLPTFSGDPLEWQTFWDSFDAAVHSHVGPLCVAVWKELIVGREGS